MRYVLDASAGVEILNRTPSGIAMTAHTFRRGAEEWTVDHFYVEVPKVIRRDVLRGIQTEARAAELQRRVAWRYAVTAGRFLGAQEWERTMPASSIVF